MYLLKLGLFSWRSEPISQIFTAVSGAALALAAYVLVYLAIQLGARVRTIEATRTVTAYLAPGAKSEGVVDALRTTLGAAPDRAIEVREANEVLRELENQDPDLARQLAGLGRDLGQVVPRYVRVSGAIPKGLEDSMKRIEGVDSLEVKRSPLQPLNATLSQMRRLGFVFGGLLLLAWWIALTHLFRVTAMRRDAHLSLLTLWGAPRWKLSIPAFIHAGLLGTASVVLSVAGFSAVRITLSALPQGIWEGFVLPPFSHAIFLGAGVFVTTLVVALFQSLGPARWLRFSS